MKPPRPSLRDVNGLLLLDKRPGVTSNQALQEVKRLYRARKAGHTGSLDPIATGLLPICLGEATKMSSFLLEDDKTYQVTIRLGKRTVTGDSEGEVVEEAAVAELDLATVEQRLDAFRGSIEQIPPMYSALKHAGRRLYELARAGIEVERAPRQVQIHTLRIIDLELPNLRLLVHCSKGTYVRTLAEDIARELGTVGHVSALRRSAVGTFEVQDAWTLEQLQALSEAERVACLRTVDAVVGGLPSVQLPDPLAYFVVKGEAVLTPKAPRQGWVRLYNSHDQFLGVGEVLDNGTVAPRRMLRALVR